MMYARLFSTKHIKTFWSLFLVLSLFCGVVRAGDGDKKGLTLELDNSGSNNNGFTLVNENEQMTPKNKNSSLWEALFEFFKNDDGVVSRKKKRKSILHNEGFQTSLISLLEVLFENQDHVKNLLDVFGLYHLKKQDPNCYDNRPVDALEELKKVLEKPDKDMKMGDKIIRVLSLVLKNIELFKCVFGIENVYDEREKNFVQLWKSMEEAIKAKKIHALWGVIQSGEQCFVTWHHFFEALQNQESDVVEKLVGEETTRKHLKHGPKGYNPLHYVAFEARHYDTLNEAWERILEALLEPCPVDCYAVVEVDAAADKGYTALHLAVLGGNIELVTYLVQKGASVSRVVNNKNNTTPLDYRYDFLKEYKNKKDKEIKDDEMYKFLQQSSKNLNLKVRDLPKDNSQSRFTINPNWEKKTNASRLVRGEKSNSHS